MYHLHLRLNMRCMYARYFVGSAAGSAAYYTLLNLFGEFPLAGELSTGGRFLAVFTSVCAVAVVAIPTGIFGNGFGEKV
jgi:hypothetical protein